MTMKVSGRVWNLFVSRKIAEASLHEFGFRPCVGHLDGDFLQYSVWRSAGTNDDRILLSGTAKQTAIIARVPEGATSAADLREIWRGNFLDLAQKALPEQVGALERPPVFADAIDRLYKLGFALAVEQGSRDEQTLNAHLPLEQSLRAQVTTNRQGLMPVIFFEARASTGPAATATDWRRVDNILAADLSGTIFSKEEKDRIAELLAAHATQEKIPLSVFRLAEKRLQL